MVALFFCFITGEINNCDLFHLLVYSSHFSHAVMMTPSAVCTQIQPDCSCHENVPCLCGLEATYY